MTSVTLQEILADKTIKAKTKTEMISNLLLSGKIGMQELVTLAGDSKDPAKATCIEALEFASRQQPDVVNLKTFQFVVQSLASKAPRVKWESAKVIGNTARLFPDKLDDAIKNLLDNTESDGTVVRWSAAFALGEILKLKTKHNRQLLPALEAVCKREVKNSIRKIYLEAMKKIEK